MTNKITIYDRTENKFISSNKFLETQPELVKVQLEKLVQELNTNGQLKGLLIDYHGDNTWKVQVKNELNQLEIHLIRNEKLAPPDKSAAPLDLSQETLGVFSDEKMAYSPYLGENLGPWYVELNEYCRKYFSTEETTQIYQIINKLNHDEKVDGGEKLSHITFKIKTKLSTGKTVDIIVRVI